MLYNSPSVQCVIAVGERLMERTASGFSSYQWSAHLNTLQWLSILPLSMLWDLFAIDEFLIT